MLTVLQVPQWMVCFENGEWIVSFGCVNGRTFFLWIPQNMTKIWPNLGHKRKRILRFFSFWVTCKILLYPGRDLNPHALASSRFWVYRVYHSTTRAFEIENWKLKILKASVSQNRVQKYTLFSTWRNFFLWNQYFFVFLHSFSVIKIEQKNKRYN